MRLDPQTSSLTVARDKKMRFLRKKRRIKKISNDIWQLIEKKNKKHDQRLAEIEKLKFYETRNFK